jgi:hypothetical protein
MNIFIFALGKVLEIDVGKCPPFLICMRYEIIGQVKRKRCQDDSRIEIGPEHPVIADPAAENSNDLSVGCHLRGEIDYGDKCEKVTEQVDEIRNKIKIVIEDDGMKRCMFGNKFINVFRQVKNNDDQDQQGDRIEKSTQEFFNDIVIDGFHR